MNIFSVFRRKSKPKSIRVEIKSHHLKNNHWSHNRVTSKCPLQLALEEVNPGYVSVGALTATVGDITYKIDQNEWDEDKATTHIRRANAGLLKSVFLKLKPVKN